MGLFFAIEIQSNLLNPLIGARVTSPLGKVSSNTHDEQNGYAQSLRK
nr:MAG TPA: hypothetical protein [Caudoviricetes sp.]